MDHDARGGQGQALPLGSRGHDEGRHTGRQPQIDGDDLALDVLHAVKDGQSRNDGASWTVDVEVNGLGGVLRVQVEHHADDLVGQLVVDLGPQKDDSLPVQTVVNVHPVSSLRAWHPVGHLGHSDRHHGDLTSSRTSARPSTNAAQRLLRCGDPLLGHERRRYDTE
eukprot:scaffold495256_cov71-Attheya_sp.AAC.1